MRKYCLIWALTVCSLAVARGDAFKGNYTYCGELQRYVEGVGDYVPVGKVTAKAFSVNQKKKTCKAVATIEEAGRIKYTVSGWLNLGADGRLHGSLKGKNGGWNIEWLDGTEFSASHATQSYCFFAYRNYFEGADAKAHQNEILRYKGVWNAEMMADQYGLFYLNCVVNAKGAVLIKGWSWNGGRLNGKAKLGYKDGGYRFPVLVAPFSEGKSGAMVFSIQLGDGKMRCAEMEDGTCIPYVIRNRDSFYSAAPGNAGAFAAEIVSFDGGKGLGMTDGKYYVHGETPQTAMPRIGDQTMFGFPVLASLGWPSYAVNLTVKGTSWTFPKAGKVTASGVYTGTNPCGLKLTYASSRRTFKGYYYTYLLMGKKVKKLRATVNGVCWLPDGSPVRYARGVAVTKGPKGSRAYDYTCMDPDE